MDLILQVVAYVKANIGTLTSVVAYACLIASVIVKLTPTLRDDNIVKPIVKFIGKYIALDKYGPNE